MMVTVVPTTITTRRALPAALISLGVLALFGLLVLQPFGGLRPAQAQTCTVTSLADSGPGTLRAQITNAACDIIDFDAGILPGTVTLANQLTIGRDVTISGPGADQLAVSGNDVVRVFEIGSGNTVAIYGLAIAGGSTTDSGGGIRNEGTLIVTDAIVSGNSAASGAGISSSGGGIWNGGTLTVQDSRLSGNFVTGINNNGGGGLFNGNDGDVTVTNSTISDNFADEGGGIRNSGDVTVTNSDIFGNSGLGGGGILNWVAGAVTVESSNITDNFRGAGIWNMGELTVTNSTISDNSRGGILNGGELTVTNSTISGNSTDAFGGGIYSGSEGVATVENSIVSGNYATDFGGGIANGGTLTVTNSTVSGNSAGSGSGGIWNGGMLTVTSTTIAGNSATDFGGGIANGGTLTVTNSTVSDNFATDFGGGIFNRDDGEATVTNSSIVGNSGIVGGGIYNEGIVTVKNSITANSSSGGNCSGTLNILGDNLADEGSCTGFTQVPDVILGPLADNGGPTLTHALLPGSPAIDAVTDCTLADGVTPLATDQRGVPRPQGPACDVGAFEVEGAWTPTPTPTGPTPTPTLTPTPTPSGGPSPTPAPTPGSLPPTGGTYSGRSGSQWPAIAVALGLSLASLGAAVSYRVATGKRGR